MQHLLERGVIVIHVLEEPGRTSWAHNLWGGRSRQESPSPFQAKYAVLLLPLKVVEKVQEEVQEIKDEWEDENIEGNGGLKVEEIRS